MAEFDPQKFEDKYTHYFAELQRAYQNAFEEMNDTYDSDLIHAIDQRILAESEPFYEGGGDFRVDLPADATDRLDHDDLEAILEEYVETIETELADVFGLREEAV